MDEQEHVLELRTVMGVNGDEVKEEYTKFFSFLFLYFFTVDRRLK